MTMKRHFKYISVLVLFAGISANSSAQALFNVVGNTTLKVNPTEILFIQGGLSNSNAGAIDNEGTIYVSGNWDNDNSSGGLVATTGTVELNGNAQAIGGAQATTFNNLALTGGAGSVKTLNQNTTVGGNSGVLNIGTDVLDLNGNALTISNSASSAILKSSGYIMSETNSSPYGNVKWQIGTNAATYQVPFGSGVGGSDVAIGLSTSGASGNGDISFATYPSDAANMPYPSGVVSLAAAPQDIADRYWIIDPKGYSTTPLFANVAFNYNDPNDVDLNDNAGIVEADLQAIRYNSQTGMWLDWGPIGVANVSSNLVNVANIPANQFYPTWSLVESSISTSTQSKTNASFGIRQLYSPSGNGSLHLGFNSPVSGAYQVRVYDMLGRQLAEKTVKASVGLNETNIDLNDPSQGVYSLILQSGENFESRKVVLNK